MPPLSGCQALTPAAGAEEGAGAAEAPVPPLAVATLAVPTSGPHDGVPALGLVPVGVPPLGVAAVAVGAAVAVPTNRSSQ
jgi:hypothetical protein